ncbi:MAG: hypothetical protein IKO72_03725 [Kiritimatiellae bacterium]|nr:hypothetical protein [Kiritimatiellia bacterium]
MMSAFTSLLQACLAVVVATLIVVWACDCGFVPLRKFAAFVRRPMVEIVLVAAIALGFIRHGSTKGTNGLDRSGTGLDSCRYSEVQSGELSEAGVLRSGASAAGHRFTGIACRSNSVALDVALEGFEVPPFLEFFARTNLVEGQWTPIGWVETEIGETNLSVEVEADRLPGGVMPQAAFFAAMAYDGLGGDDDDDDNDGISNADERAIASAFVGNIKSGNDIITAWRDANDTAKGRNACVIDCSRTPHQFWFWDESSGSPIWTKKEKGVASW